MPAGRLAPLALVVLVELASFSRAWTPLAVPRSVPVPARRPRTARAAEPEPVSPAASEIDAALSEPSIEGRTILVAGANGNFGSKVVRALLRGDAKCKVRAVVRSTGDLANYGRLSYESGAEDGQGTISAPWVSREISFEGTPEMRSFGLGRLEVVEGDLLDQGFVRRVTFGVDAVVFCAASPAFRPFQIDPISLLRDFVYKQQGRLEDGETVEERGVGLALRYLIQEMQRRTPDRVEGAPTSFVLLSSAAAGGDAPLGGVGAPGNARVQAQRAGEMLVRSAKSLPSYAIVRLPKVNDWQPEGVPLVEVPVPVEDLGDVEPETTGDLGSVTVTDGARFLVRALTNRRLRNRTMRVYADPNPAAEAERPGP